MLIFIIQQFIFMSASCVQSLFSVVYSLLFHKPRGSSIPMILREKLVSNLPVVTVNKKQNMNMKGVQEQCQYVNPGSLNLESVILSSLYPKISFLNQLENNNNKMDFSLGRKKCQAYELMISERIQIASVPHPRHQKRKKISSITVICKFPLYASCSAVNGFQVCPDQGLPRTFG